MYFKLQMLVTLLLAFTYPGGAGKSALFHGSASLKGLIYEADFSTTLLPLTMMFVFSATNVLFVAPRTISTMWKLHVGMCDKTARP